MLPGLCLTLVAWDGLRFTLGGQRVWECGYELGDNRKAYGHC